MRYNTGDKELDAMLNSLASSSSKPKISAGTSKVAISTGIGVGADGNNNHPSTFGKVLAFLSRPAHASAEAVHRAFDPKDNDGGINFTGAISGFGSGLAGHSHETFKDVLNEHGANGAGMGTLGFALDVLGDPLTYAGGIGIASKAIKGVDLAGNALTKAERGKMLLEAANPLNLTGKSRTLNNAAKKAVKAKTEAEAAAAAKEAAAVDTLSHGIKPGETRLSPGVGKQGVTSVEAKGKFGPAAVYTPQGTTSIGVKRSTDTFHVTPEGLLPSEAAQKAAHEAKFRTPKSVVLAEKDMPNGRYSMYDRLMAQGATPKEAAQLEILNATRAQKAASSVEAIAETAAPVEAEKFVPHTFDTAPEEIKTKILEERKLLNNKYWKKFDQHAWADEIQAKTAHLTVAQRNKSGFIPFKGKEKYSLEEIKANPAKLEALLGSDTWRAFSDAHLQKAADKHLEPLNKAAQAEFDKAAAERLKAAQTIATHAETPAVAAEAAKTIDEIIQQATPAVEKSTAKSVYQLNADEKLILDDAIQNHLLNHGEKALSHQGQLRLRQLISSKYGRMAGGHGSGKAQQAINEIYKTAESLLASKMGPAAFTDGRVKLSQVLDHIGPLKTNSFKNDFGSILNGTHPDAYYKALHTQLDTPAALRGITFGQGISGVAPKIITSEHAKFLLANAKADGHAAEIEASVPVTVDRINTYMAAVDKDLKLRKPTIPIRKPLTDRQLYEASSYLDKLPDILTKAFVSLRGATPWEKGVLQTGRAEAAHLKEVDINELHNIFSGDKPGFKNSWLAAQAATRAGETATGTAQKIQEYMTKFDQMITHSGVPAETFKKFLPKEYHGVLEDGWAGLSDVSNPVKAMAEIANAVHNATLNQVVLGQLKHTFGGLAKGEKGYDEALKSGGYDRAKNIDGIIFPKGAPVERVSQLLDLLKPGNTTKNEFLRGYDKTLGLYKTGLTKYLPSHHINNDIGQKWMAFMDGVGFQWYPRAIKVMNEVKGAADGVGAGGRVILTTPAGHQLTAHQIWRLAEQNGVRPSFSAISDLVGAEPKIKSAIPAWVDKASSAREMHNRLAHFMYALTQSKETDLALAGQGAAMRVLRSHIDYADLTAFERNYLRRAIPFYTWMRKAAPTVIIASAQNPGRMLVLPKLQQDINKHFGINPTDSNPFPGLPLTPEYLRELTPALIYHQGKNPVYSDPHIPFNDVVGKELNHPLGNILDMLTPALKIPYELRSGTSIGNSNIPVGQGSAFGPGGKLQYIERQTPMLSPLISVAGKDLLGNDLRKNANEDESGMNLARLLSLLTGAAFHEETDRARANAQKAINREAASK